MSVTTAPTKAMTPRMTATTICRRSIRKSSIRQVRTRTAADPRASVPLKAPLGEGGQGGDLGSDEDANRDESQ
jgi:hypothetical protein